MKSCPKCFQTHEDEVEVCDCGFTLIAPKNDASSLSGSSQNRNQSFLPKKYPSLRTVSSYFIFIAWANITISIIASALLAFEMLTGKSLIFVPGIFVCLFLGIASFIVAKAFGELIIVLVDIEENQRRMIVSAGRVGRDIQQ